MGICFIFCNKDLVDSRINYKTKWELDRTILQNSDWNSISYLRYYYNIYKSCLNHPCTTTEAQIYFQKDLDNIQEKIKEMKETISSYTQQIKTEIKENEYIDFEMLRDNANEILNIKDQLKDYNCIKIYFKRVVGLSEK